MALIFLHQLYLDRYAITQIHPSLHRHGEIVARITADGMSSDEEDTSTPGGRQFLIIEKPWRAPQVTQFLRTLDLISRAYKREKRGQPMRYRIEGPQRSESDAVPGLPENFYEDEWLQGLQEWKRIMYQIKVDEEWDYSFPDWVSECVPLSYISLTVH